MPELANSETGTISALPALEPEPAVDESALLSSTPDPQEERDGWEEVIDRHLIEWGRDPGQLEDEDIVPPSAAVIRRAVDIARSLQAARLVAPTAVVPDGTGGIAFERRAGPVFESIEVRADGSVELMSFENSRLTVRRRLI